MKLLTRIVAALLFASQTAMSAPESPRPNIIIILADDLGYGDVSCNGATKIKGTQY